MNKMLIVLAVLVIFGCEQSQSSEQQAGADKAIAQKNASATEDTAAQAPEDIKVPTADDKYEPVEPDVKDGKNGPTVYLFGENGEYPKNDLADFMYFVPLISPVSVSALTSQNNTQGGNLLSCERSSSGNKFKVSCEFRMEGKGSYVNEFDSKEMIEWNTKEGETKHVFKNILSYIKFKGEGYGWIEAVGTIKGSELITDKVVVHFNARGAESPVSIGLFDVDLTGQKGDEHGRYNYKVAMVNSLSFERTDGKPMLGIKIAAVGSDEDSLGAWAHFKGWIGNMFIDPLEIAKVGNDTMLEFGAVLYEQQPTFTFPLAEKLKQAAVASN